MTLSHFTIFIIIALSNVHITIIAQSITIFDFFEKEGLRPILDLDLRLGEGTGAALAMQIIQDSVRLHNEMATFEAVGIEPGA